MYALFSSILSIAIITIFTVSHNKIVLWILPFIMAVYTIKKTNYVTTRIVLMVFLFIISLCGDTNYVLYYFAVDFVLSMCLVLVKRKSLKMSMTGSMMWMILLLVGCVAGGLYAKDEVSFHVGVMIYALIVCLLISSENIITIQSLHNVIIFSAILSANIAILTIFFLNNSMAYVTSISRGLIRLLGDTGIRSNTLAGIVVTFFILFAFYPIEVLERDFKSRMSYIIVSIIKWVVIVGDIIVLLLLQSRGSFVAIAVVILVTIYRGVADIKRMTSRDGFKLIGGIGGLIFALMLPKIQTLILDKIFLRFMYQADITNGRISLFEIAFGMWKQHPMIGNGFLQFAAYDMEYADPHNFVLGYLASVGIIGTSCLLIYIRKLLQNCRILSEDTRVFSLVVIAQLIHGLFEPVLTTSLPLSLFMITCSVLYLLKNGEKNSVKESKLSLQCVTDIKSSHSESL